MIKSCESEENKTEEKRTYKCNQCKDAGVIIEQNTDTLQKAARTCQCRLLEAKKKRMSKLLQFANIPREYQDIRVKDFDTNRYSDRYKIVAENAKDLGDRYIKAYPLNDMGKGLYLYSRTKGSGKTRMAISIANGIAEQFEASIKYMTVHELTTSIQSTFKSKDLTSEEIENQVIDVDLLILDDLAVENTTKWSEAILYNIIDKRNELKKPTIFTANIPIRELPYKEGRIQSRINRMTIEIPFPEESVRDQIAEHENEEFLRALFS